MGFRQELVKVLRKKNIPFFLWSDKPVHRIPTDCLAYHQEAFPHDSRILRAILKRINFTQPISHVLACTENAVFPAAFARRFYDARSYAQSVLIKCSDKVDMKLYVENLGIPVAKFRLPAEGDSADQLREQLGLPTVIKDRIGSGSRNLVFAQSSSEILANMGHDKIYEGFIDAPEGSIESFVSNGQILFSNITEYYEKRHTNLVPASYSQKEKEMIQEFNENVIKGMHIQWGMTHLEFYRTKNDLVFGEIALRPPGGYIMELIHQTYGFNPWEAFLAVELGEDFLFPKQPQQYGASCILHPGHGQLIAIRGYEEALRIPSVKKLKIKAKLGDQISTRASVGNDIGYAILTSASSQNLMDNIEEFHRTLRFEVHPEGKI
jgi:biotin carboxylase